MGFVPSPLSQRLLDLALEIMPNVVTDTITRTPKTNLLPSWDPFECGPEDMAAIRDALKDMATKSVSHVVSFLKQVIAAARERNAANRWAWRS